jgi:hypothetical protein
MDDCCTGEPLLKRVLSPDFPLWEETPERRVYRPGESCRPARRFGAGGLSEDELPLGLQVIGRAFAEADMLRVA